MSESEVPSPGSLQLPWFFPAITPILPTLSRHQPLFTLRIDFIDFGQGQTLRWGSREGFGKARQAAMS